MIFRNNLIRFLNRSIWVCFCLVISSQCVNATSLPVTSKLDPVIMEMALKQAVMMQIYKKTPSLTSENIVYELTNRHQLQVIPARAHSFEFEISRKAALIGRTIVPCVFYDRHHERIKQTLLYIDVDWVGPVVLADRLLRKGVQITTSDIRIERRSLQTEPSRHLSSLEDVVGLEVLITVPEGATLTTWSVGPKPVVRKGQKIFLLTDRSNVQLKVRGIALEDGVVGQEIRVRTLLGKSKIMKGIVSDNETVQIKLLY